MGGCAQATGRAGSTQETVLILEVVFKISVDMVADACQTAVNDGSTHQSAVSVIPIPATVSDLMCAVDVAGHPCPAEQRACARLAWPMHAGQEDAFLDMLCFVVI